MLRRLQGWPGGSDLGGLSLGAFRQHSEGGVGRAAQRQGPGALHLALPRWTCVAGSCWARLFPPLHHFLSP